MRITLYYAIDDGSTHKREIFMQKKRDREQKPVPKNQYLTLKHSLDIYGMEPSTLTTLTHRQTRKKTK